jgi:hypothetical protein
MNNRMNAIMPKNRGPKNGSRRAAFGRRWLIVWLAISLALVGKSLWSSDAELRAVASADRTADAALMQASIRSTPAPAAIQRTFRPIEELRVGDRVVSDNPETETPLESKVDPRTWRLLKLYAEERWPDGTLDTIHVETLQSPEWIEAHGANVGAQVPPPLDLLEMGLSESLLATVVANEPCPQLETGAGRLALTTVNHLNADVWELTAVNASGVQEQLRPTGFHKFYSDTRHDWISAKEIHDNEVIRGRAGPLRIVGKKQQQGVERVYNLTVEGEHVYYVSELGLLVHNTGCQADILFGQKRIGERFRLEGPNPDLAGRTLEEVASDLRIGLLTPDDIPIGVFQDPVTKSLVTVNNRGLAALTMAGLKPSIITHVPLTGDIMERLSEDAVDRFHPVIGRRIAVTKNKDGSGHLYSVFMGGK